MVQKQIKPTRLLHPAQVEERTSLSRTTIVRKVKAGEFPAPIPLSEKRVAWVEEEVEAWVRSRVDARRPAVA